VLRHPGSAVALRFAGALVDETEVVGVVDRERCAAAGLGAYAAGGEGFDRPIVGTDAVAVKCNAAHIVLLKPNLVSFRDYGAWRKLSKRFS
jgi:hypothetical protein